MAWPRPVGPEVEVVVDVAAGRHAEGTGRHPHELAVGVLDGRRREGEDVGRHDPLGQVVDPLEAVAAPRDAEVAGPVQPLEDLLAMGPAPPRPAGGPAVGQLAGRERAAIAHLGQHGSRVARPLALDPVDRSPPAVTKALHAPAPQRLGRHRHQAGGVAPVLEELAVALGALLDERPPVRPQPGEHRQLVGPDEHVDRVDLEEPGPIDEAAQVAAVDPACRARVGEALRGEDDAPRGGCRQTPAVDRRSSGGPGLGHAGPV